MKISVIIPNLNGGEFLGECLESIVTQDELEKEIIVMDGGSTDLSLRIIRDYEKHLSHWESNPDGGPYHAVEKGLNMASGDILCWINSDDILLPGALKEAVEIFSEESSIQWISGIHATFLEMPVLQAKKYPKIEFFLSDETRYAVQLFRNFEHVDWTLDYILKEAPRGGYFLQQESTFWKKELWKSVGGFDHRFRLAADYWLWLQFLKLSPITLVDRPFGVFRQWPGQRSVSFGEQYQREALEIAAQNMGTKQFTMDAENSQAGKATISAPGNQSLIQIRRVVRERICLATSIAPFDVNKQAFCIRTWLKQGCRVLSFNTPEEIETIQSAGHATLREVEFIPVMETAKATAGKDLVLLRDIIAHYQKQDPDTILGIINSDIMIDSHIDLLSFARRNCAGDQCLVSSRVDVEDFCDREGDVFIGGFDVFLFRSPHLRNYPMDSEFALGAPWWDYFLPHFLSETVETVNYPKPIPFYHKLHTTNYSIVLWENYGKHFLQFFDSDLSKEFAELAGFGYRTGFLATVARQFVRNFYHNCQARSPVEWAALPAYGSGYHSRIEKMHKRIHQWADRAILAEELLQNPPSPG